MKKITEYIFVAVVLLFATASCKDILEQKSVDAFTEQSVWEDINLSKAYLGNCYDKIGGDGGQLLGMREDLLASSTDECICIHRPGEYTFVKGTLSPDELGNLGSWKFSFLGWQYLYSNIKNVNVFLANIDKVPTKTTADEALIARMKGEAYFIRAYDYTQLLLGHGGVVLVSDAFELGQDYLTSKRATLKETRDFILADIEKAITALPKNKEIEQGRATKGAAAALKSRLLLFCASKLVNGGYEPTNTLVSFTDGTQAERWTAARDAAKFVIDGNAGTFSLTGTTVDPPATMTEEEIKVYADNYYNIFNQKGEWNSEVIWGVQYLMSQGNTVNPNIWNGPNGYHNWGNNGPLEPTVRAFEMADGTPFKWDIYNPGNELTRTATASELIADPKRNPYNGREPRLYGSILYNGAKWQARPTDMVGFDPLGIIQTGYIINADGTTTAGADTRQATVESWNGTKNGYYLKKFMDINSQGQYFSNENSWIEFRYAEILLNHAEACIELGGADLQNGLVSLNMVRNRAGLPDRVTTDQAIARQFVRHERRIEFFAEGHRWYDIRRWMIAGDVITNVQAMKIFKYADGKTEWKVDNLTVVDDRSWKVRQYWIPISRTEMNKAPQLVQNPGY